MLYFTHSSASQITYNHFRVIRFSTNGCSFFGPPCTQVCIVSYASYGGDTRLDTTVTECLLFSIGLAYYSTAIQKTALTIYENFTCRYNNIGMLVVNIEKKMPLSQHG